jgi:hypothetical protein
MSVQFASSKGSIVAENETLPPQLHAEFSQVSPVAHGLSQAPQCNGLDVVSTHAAPQGVRAPQSDPQVPSRQNSPAPHASPQTPQCSGSDAVSTQAPPHASVPAAHSHSPSLHPTPAGQVRPQPPQCRGSDDVSMQTPPPQVSQVGPSIESIHPPMHSIWWSASGSPIGITEPQPAVRAITAADGPD